MDDYTILEQPRLLPEEEKQKLWIVEQQQYYGEEAAENDVNHNENDKDDIKSDFAYHWEDYVTTGEEDQYRPYYRGHYFFCNDMNRI
eukprot:179858-Amphidinium_carterae.1